jgi:hypothetical protein
VTAVQVKDAAGKVVWTSCEVEQPLVEVVENVVRVTEFGTGQVVDTYALKPGEKVSR